MRKIIYYLLFSSALFMSCSDDDKEYINPDDIIVIEDSKPSAPIASSGFYVANEDWFGHDNGTVNFFKNDGSVIYRAYRAANPDEILGVTTCFATIYGDNAYFVSKQGNRLVVADAKTLKKKASLTDIGGDGRSFLGVNPNKGYIGTLQGVTLFNIKNLSVGNAIEGISGQVGNMCLLGNRVFVLVQNKGVYVINGTTDSVETLIEGSFNCMTQSKDGYIWIGAGSNLMQINPHSLTTTNVDVTSATIDGSWGAWNAGSLCASTQENVLYWTSKSSVVKYNIDSQELNSALYTLGADEEDAKLAFYGASLRVDPLTNKLVLIVKRSGWGASGSYNWIHIITNNGVLEKNIEVRGDNGSGLAWGTNNDRYFWFPSMPFFEDINAPEILLNQVILKPNETVSINLNDKVHDADNTPASMIKSIEYTESNLVKYNVTDETLKITALDLIGKTTFKFKAISNGKVVEKQIRVDIRE